MSSPLVSVVLVTLDGAATLPGVLESLTRQETDFDFEIVAVDSGSTDGTLDLLSTKVDRLVRIAGREFNHGATRNLAIEASRGEFLVLLVQDAEPANREWLREIVAPLRSRPDVAGCFARQVPRPEASALARRALERWVAAGAEPRVTEPVTSEAFDRLAPLERMALSTFDNVASCLRREVWRSIPFAPTPMAEDLQWGRDVVRAGLRLAFAPRAVVVHSHDRELWYELQRTYLLHRRLHDLFGVRLIPAPGNLARSILRNMPEHARLALKDAKRPVLAIRTLCLAAIWPLGQYLGGRAAARRRGVAFR